MEFVMRIYTDVEEARRTVLQRAGVEDVDVPPALAASLERLFGRPVSPAEAVETIVRDVRRRGDAALMEWIQRIDGIALAGLEVPREAWQAARDALDPSLREALELAVQRIADFHRRQYISSWTAYGDDGVLGQIVRPLERVGVYVPAGTAPLPSSLLMSAVPARAAGVKEIIVVSPPDRRTGEVAPVILAAAAIAGADRVFRAGGAQAIAALAYGTGSIPRVDKIVGPGNLFVALAKRMVYGQVGIDGVFGPTETLVIADESVSPAVVAADLLAQAEHDALASAILLTPSEHLAHAVQEEVRRQAERLSHVMPTGGTARFASPLSVMDFVKITNLVALGRSEFDVLGPAAARIAEAEGLTAHANAVYLRRPAASSSEPEG